MAKEYESPPAATPRDQSPEPAPAPSPTPLAFHHPMIQGRDNATLIIGALLVVLGALFLLGQVVNFPIEWSRYGWPVFVIAPGLVLFALMALGGRYWSGLALPASIVTVTGIILFVQNATDLWETWSYAWALIFPTAVGLGTWIQGNWTGDRDLAKRGQNMVALGIVLFLVFAAFFEGVLGISHLGGSQVVRVGIPVALIVVGAALLASREIGRHPAT